MDFPASQLIDSYGGTTAVAQAMKTRVSTVQSWKKSGFPDGRRAHFDLLVETGRLITVDAAPQEPAHPVPESAAA